MDSKSKYKVLGLMSGTSLDGLDIAYCVFTKKANGWHYTIEKAVTIKYPATWIAKLATAQNLSGEKLMELDAAYGKYIGKACTDFITRHQVKPDFIASHGHTIFHQPKNGFTFQLGSGQAIFATSGIPVVYDFRSLDVLLGGEGAPLVPAGDKFLFSDYDICLNLGGIANLSVETKQSRVAYDICFVNMGLNYLAAKAAKAYDANGEMASEGQIDKKLLKKIATVYNGTRTKRPSLGRELFEKKLIPLLDNVDITVQDRLHTFTESCATEIAAAITAYKPGAKVLCTGGGTFNAYLITRILDLCEDKVQLIIPDNDIVKFKEALVFAFLGILRTRNETNSLKSVTNATRNSSSGLMAGFK